MILLRTFNRFRASINEFKTKKLLNNFKTGGYKPWTPGYNLYKWEAIVRVLNENNFYSVIGSKDFGYHIDERIVEYPWFLTKLSNDPLVLLDAGSALNHEIIVNHPKLQNKKLFISTLSPEKQSFWNKGISYVYEDLRETCFRKEMFDCISSISTIEHIGLNNSLIYTKDITKAENQTTAYKLFVDTLHALLKPGGSLFLTFPYGLFFNHGWFQVFNSEMIDSVVERFNPRFFSEEIFEYKHNGWCPSTREDAKNSVCFDIQTQKNYDSDFAACSRAIACLELKK
jgi:hypothetical protein